jgi:hypothetical protein
MPRSIVQTVHLSSIWQSNLQVAQKDYVLVALLMEAPLPQFMAIGIFRTEIILTGTYQGNRTDVEHSIVDTGKRI